MNIHSLSSLVFVASVSTLAILTGCSSSGDGGSKTADPTGEDDQGATKSGSNGDSSSPKTGDSTNSSSSSSTDLATCVKPGDKGNDKGIGAYCQATADCTSGLLCTKDFGAGPDDPTFCTIPCTKDAECGANAICYTDTRGQGCLPTVCKP